MMLFQCITFSKSSYVYSVLSPSPFSKSSYGNANSMHILARNCLFNALISKVIRPMSAQYPLHNVTYTSAKFKVTTSNGLGGDTFTIKTII